jgi:hypothetical protein
LGRKIARAVGTYRGNMDYSAPAVVRLSHPERCPHLPERVYSHFWIRIGADDPVSYRLDGCL